MTLKTLVTKIPKQKKVLLALVGGSVAVLGLVVIFARQTETAHGQYGYYQPLPAGSHNAHNLEMVTVYYRWHPLFGRSLPVRRRSHHREGERIYCEAPDGRICFLPTWMLSPECSRFPLGPPQVSLAALRELHNLLATWQAAFPCDKASRRPTRKEGCGEEIGETTQRADESVAPQSARNDHSQGQAGRTHGGPGRVTD